MPTRGECGNSLYFSLFKWRRLRAHIQTSTIHISLSTQTDEARLGGPRTLSLLFSFFSFLPCVIPLGQYVHVSIYPHPTNPTNQTYPSPKNQKHPPTSPSFSLPPPLPFLPFSPFPGDGAMVMAVAPSAAPAPSPAAFPSLRTAADTRAPTRAAMAETKAKRPPAAAPAAGVVAVAAVVSVGLGLGKRKERRKERKPSSAGCGPEVSESPEAPVVVVGCSGGGGG